MRDVSQRCAKDPTSKQRVFTNDSAAKQKEASGEVWNMVTK